MPRSVRRVLRRMLKSSRGQSLAEFALVSPLFFLTIFGIVDFSRMVQSYVTIQHSAREGVRYAVTGRADCGATTPTRLTCVDYVARKQSEGLTNAAAKVSVSVRSWAFQSGGYSSTPTLNSAGIQCDDVEVAVSYDYKPITPLIGGLFGTVPLHASERLVNEPFGPCGT